MRKRERKREKGSQGAGFRGYDGSKGESMGRFERELGRATVDYDDDDDDEEGKLVPPSFPPYERAFSQT